jgi:hypothetical protein
MRQDDIDNWFQYHAPTSDQVQTYNDVRNKAKELAELLNSVVPDCADKTAAMRHLRETVMAINLTIACYQSPTAESLQAILDSPERPDVHINPDGSVTAD